MIQSSRSDVDLNIEQPRIPISSLSEMFIITAVSMYEKRFLIFLLPEYEISCLLGSSLSVIPFSVDTALFVLEKTVPSDRKTHDSTIRTIRNLAYDCLYWFRYSRKLYSIFLTEKLDSFQTGCSLLTPFITFAIRHFGCCYWG